MQWFQEFIDAFTQWLVSAPIAVQMLILIITVVPTMVVVAWFMMYVIDWIGFKIRPVAQPTNGRRSGETKIVTHVDP